MTMKIRCIIGSAAVAATLTCSGAWAWDQDPAAQYLERKDTIVSGAGDARDVNAATHIIDPWPPYVGNRRIPMSGERAAKTVECYQTYNQGRPKGGAPTAGTQPSASSSVTIGGLGGSSSIGQCANPPIQNLYDRTIGIVGASQ
jgi:hypothetical protein